MKDYEQIISTLLAKIADLEKLVIQQAARIAELEKRLDKNSRNSSKPPSSDGLSKPPRTTSIRENGKHKSGGQLGHKGERLKQIETPDIIKKHVLTTCPDCHHSLRLSSLLGIVKRQVFDIPAPKIEITEHQAEVKYCKCCNKSVTAAFPAGVCAPVQYGKRGQQPRRTGHNLLLRLFHYKPDVLRFLHDPAVPFTNNDAERDLRMMKCKQKISGGFRSTQGAEQFARIRGFISTVRKQGFNVLNSIQSVFSGNMLIPAGY